MAKRLTKRLPKGAEDPRLDPTVDRAGIPQALTEAADITEPMEPGARPLPTGASPLLDMPTMPWRAVGLGFQHPRYVQFKPIWRALGYVYEGDGPLLDGSALIPHPREIIYKQKADGTLDLTSIVDYRLKFKRRQELARYENFASAIVDTIVDHQFRKAPKRSGATDEYLAWLDNVDGAGTAYDDWVKATQSMASVYGHLYVTMARAARPGQALVANPVSRAQQGDLVLRRYLPEDVPDWLAPQGRLRSVKLVEAVERGNLFEPVTQASRTVGSEDTQYGTGIRYRIVDTQAWGLYDEGGQRIEAGLHGFYDLPVVPFYSRRRARIPVIGRSLLRDPQLYIDHYNLVSELRELIRSQIFSILHIQLADNQTVQQQMELMGDQQSTDTYLFTKGGAAFLQPSGGPAEILQNQIEALERKIYRLVGLPWEGDSLAPESGESRRLKAMDLNRILAGQADEAQAFEYYLAKLWYQGEYQQSWEAKWGTATPKLEYPDEFYVEQVGQEIDEARAKITLRLGRTADAEIKKRSLDVVLPDLDPKMRKQVESEIDELVTREAEAEAAFETFSLKGAEAAAASSVSVVDSGEGEVGTVGTAPASSLPSAAFGGAK